MFDEKVEMRNPVETTPSGRFMRWSSRDRLILIGLLMLITLLCIGQSGMKLFWYDELITLHIADLPTQAAIIHFYEQGKDTTSFLPAILVHIFKVLPGRPELATRIPFSVAYLVTCTCFWTFIFRRYGAAFATAGTLLFIQGWTLYFASEIRAYAFLLMGAAIAVSCWQGSLRSSRQQVRWQLGVFFGLSIAVLFHFFAVFLLPPFLVAEWYYSRTTHKVRWGMFAAILLSPASISIMLPNMLAAHRVYGGTFWSKPTVGLLTSNYQLCLEPLVRNAPELLVLFAILLWARHRGSGRAPSGEDIRTTGYLRSEWLLLTGIALVPVVAFLGGKVLGLYRAQYVIYFQIGMILLVTGSFAEVLRMRARAGWMLAGLLLLTMAMHERDELVQGVRLLANKPLTTGLHSQYDPKTADFLRSQTLPVVAEGADTLAVMNYYDPSLKDRLVLLTSHQLAAAQPRSMTNELNMEVFGRDLNLPLQDYGAFLAAHKDFLLLVDPSQIGFDWLFKSLVSARLAGQDISLQLLWGDDPLETNQVYLVHTGANQAAAR